MKCKKLKFKVYDNFKVMGNPRAQALARRGAALRELNFHKKYNEGAKGRLCAGGVSFLRSLACAQCRNVYFIRISMKIQERAGESPCLASDNHRNCFFYVKKKKSLITRPRYNAPRASSAASLDLTLHGELRYLDHFAFENCV